MSNTSQTTARVQALLAEMNNGVAGANERLLAVVQERFRNLAHQMLRNYERIRHVEDTDDLLQRTLLRLNTVLKTIRPENPQHFFALSAQNMRWILQDLARSYAREGKLRWEMPEELVSLSSRKSGEPVTLEEWALFHEAVEKLEAPEKEMVDLLYYQGLTQEEAAGLAGIALRTVKLRWHNAKLALSEAVREKPSETG